MDKRIFGALPPDDAAWQQGKTAATIQNVHEIEYVLEHGSDEEKNELLRTLSNMLQNGELVSQAFIGNADKTASTDW